MGEENKEEPKNDEKQQEPAETVEETEVKEEAEEILEEKPVEKEETVEETTAEAQAEKEAPVEEEKAKPPREEKPEEEEEIVEERIYTIPLSKAWIMPPKKRAPKAMRIIRVFVIKHMKLEAKKEGEEEEAPKRLIISNEVNERVWRRGIEKPARNIRIRAAKNKEGDVTVYLAEGD